MRSTQIFDKSFKYNNLFLRKSYMIIIYINCTNGSNMFWEFLKLKRFKKIHISNHVEFVELKLKGVSMSMFLNILVSYKLNK